MKKPLTVILTLLLAANTGWAQTDIARELTQLRDQRDKALATAAEPINRRYQSSLEALLRRATQTSDLDTALKIRAELEKLGVPSTAGAGTGPISGSAETQRAQLRTRLRGSTWQWGTTKTFTLHPDGSTSGNWLPKKGTWKVTGPRNAELVITNSGETMKATFDDEAATATFEEERDPNLKVAKRIAK